jgi:hypothetical protein
LSAEKDDVVPLGLFLLLTGLVLPCVGGGKANIDHGVVAGRVSGLTRVIGPMLELPQGMV